MPMTFFHTVCKDSAFCLSEHIISVFFHRIPKRRLFVGKKVLAGARTSSQSGSEDFTSRFFCYLCGDKKMTNRCWIFLSRSVWIRMK